MALYTVSAEAFLCDILDYSIVLVRTEGVSSICLAERTSTKTWDFVD